MQKSAPLSQIEPNVLDHTQEEYWIQYFSDQCVINSKYHRMDDGVEILVVHSKPKIVTTLRPVILIPGWFSLPNGWDKVIKPISEVTELVYLETREKSSSITPNKKIDLSIPQLAKDFNQLVPNLPVDFEKSIVMGSSLAGSMLLDYLSKPSTEPYKVVLVGPNPDYKLPPIIGRLALAMPLFLFKIVKRYVRWHVLTFRIDRKKEPEQAQKYTEVLDAAIPWKVRKSAREVTKFHGWELLPKVTANIVLIAASSDKLHGLERSQKMDDLFPNSELIDFGSNKAIHETEFGEFLIKIAKE